MKNLPDLGEFVPQFSFDPPSAPKKGAKEGGKLLNGTKRGRPPAPMTRVISILERIAAALEAIAGIQSPRLEFVEHDDSELPFTYVDDAEHVERELGVLAGILQGRSAPTNEDAATWAAAVRTSLER